MSGLSDSMSQNVKTGIKNGILYVTSEKQKYQIININIGKKKKKRLAAISISLPTV